MNRNLVSEIAEEFAYWVFFSVVIALAQLWVVAGLLYAAHRPFTWAGLIGNGSLLFFATTITSKAAGEYFKKVKGSHRWATLICVAGMIIIIIASTSLYALVAAATIFASDSLTAARVAGMSDVLAACGLAFSLGYTLYIRAYGE